MQREATIENGTLVLDMETIDAIQAFMDAGLRDNGFVVSLPLELRMFQRLSVSLRHGQRFSFGFEVEVIQVFPAGGQAFATAFASTLPAPNRPTAFCVVISTICAKSLVAFSVSSVLYQILPARSQARPPSEVATR